MDKAILGRTGLEVTRIAMGGLFISTLGSEVEQGKAAIDRALDLGINFFDTAPNYYNSEEVIGSALKKKRKKPVILSTKLGGRPLPFRPENSKDLMTSIKESLRLLNREYIDIVYIHEPDRPEIYDWWTDKDSYNGTVMDVLDTARKDGLIGYIGLAGTTAYELANIMRTGKFDVVLTAFNYSLLFREAENEIIPLAKKLGMGIVAGSPLQQGDFSRRYDDIFEKKPSWMSLPRYSQFKELYSFVDELNITLPELAIRFVLSNPDIDCVLTGARSPGEVENTVKLMEKGALPEDILKRLDEIAGMVPFRPTGEALILGFPHKYGKEMRG